MDTSSSSQRDIDLQELENFALAGIDAQVDAIVRQPAFGVLHERIRQQAFEEGRARAREEFEKIRLEIAAGPVQKLEALLTEMAERRDEFARRNEEELLALALAAAERVLRVESSIRPEVLMKRLDACVRQLEKESSYVIRIHPEQEEALATLLARDGLPYFPDLPYRLVPDRRVPKGSLVLEGEKTRLESICADEFARLEEHLLELYREGRDGPDGPEDPGGAGGESADGD